MSGEQGPPDLGIDRVLPVGWWQRAMTRTRRLTFSLGLNVVLVAVQVVFGLTAHSLGLLADAGHNLTDVAALVLSLVAVRFALRPRTAARSFGNHRATILAALANAAAIAAVTVVIVAESIQRLQHPQPVQAGIVVIIAAVAMMANGLAALLLRDGSSDLNMRSAVLHMAGDAVGSAAVLVSGIVLLFAPSATWLDPVSALVVAAIIGLFLIILAYHDGSFSAGGAAVDSAIAQMRGQVTAAAPTLRPGVRTSRRITFSSQPLASLK